MGRGECLGTEARPLSDITRRKCSHLSTAFDYFFLLSLLPSSFPSSSISSYFASFSSSLPLSVSLSVSQDFYISKKKKRKVYDYNEKTSNIKTIHYLAKMKDRRANTALYEKRVNKQHTLNYLSRLFWCLPFSLETNQTFGSITCKIF